MTGFRPLRFMPQDDAAFHDVARALVDHSAVPVLPRERHDIARRRFLASMRAERSLHVVSRYAEASAAAGSASWGTRFRGLAASFRPVNPVLTVGAALVMVLGGTVATETSVLGTLFREVVAIAKPVVTGAPATTPSVLVSPAPVTRSSTPQPEAGGWFGLPEEAHALPTGTPAPAEVPSGPSIAPQRIPAVVPDHAAVRGGNPVPSVPQVPASQGPVHEVPPAIEETALATDAEPTVEPTPAAEETDPVADGTPTNEDEASAQGPGHSGTRPGGPPENVPANPPANPQGPPSGVGNAGGPENGVPFGGSGGAEGPASPGSQAAPGSGNGPPLDTPGRGRN